MTVKHLWLTDFRNHREVDLSLDSGVTVVVGMNGQGKTNLIEALAWLARGTSFRGAPTEAMVRNGADRAIVRAEVDTKGRTVLLEAELAMSGKNRIQVNRQRVNRLRDLLGHFRTTVFGPDDLRLIKGGPRNRRGWIDDLLVDLHPGNHALRGDLDRILRQRNTLLKQSRGRATPDVETTLDVWDAQLIEVGERLASARREVLAVLVPEVEVLMGALTGGRSRMNMEVVDQWSSKGLEAALETARPDDLKRGVTTVGPHRDEILFSLDDMPARTHASQGEQRSIVLALRLAGHRLVADRTGSEPVVLLDDVFSELDAGRCGALVGLLPSTQAVMTSAGVVPEGVDAGVVLHLDDLASASVDHRP
ncbi:MAG: DNA replication/repair protein RecF [Acidimicrobiales bacterium]|nr:DNA replication/repair protein RecF [Acidimicrobiales bacterium]